MEELNIAKYLKNFYSDGIFYSHVSMIKPRGRYLFNREELENFWDFFGKYTKDSKKKVGLAERNQNCLPVLCDIDIKVEEDEDTEYGEHIYTNEQVLQVIQIYQSVIRNIVDNPNDKIFYCVLLEKPIYKVEKNGITYLKNGFHLHFPYLFLSKSDQEEHLIPRITDLLNDLKVFDNLCEDRDSASFFDKAYCNVPWLLYGSVKDETKEPYKITKIYDMNCEEISMEHAFRNYQIYDNRERLIKIEGKIEKYLPRILSIHPYNREVSELKYGLISAKKEIEKKQNIKNNKNTKLSVAQALQISEKLLPMLAQWRAEDRNEWMSIGWTLFCISNGCQEGLDQWLDFSSRDRKNFNEEECIEQWSKMTKKDLSIGSLKFYAKADNEERFNEFIREQGQKYMKNSLEGSHNDIAKLLYNDYCTDFVCSSISNKTWYQFVDHIWEEIEEGKFLRDKISDEVVDKYLKMGSEFFQNMQGTDDNDTKQLQQKITKLQKLIANLKSAPYKINVMKESADVFYNKNFRNKLNLNPYLIGFKNGVYDLKLNVFRAGRPEDYLSKRMPINYVDFNRNDKKVLEVYNFLEKVFPDSSVRRYFMDNVSDLFVGGNHQKIVVFWLGHGDNGKSVTQLFLDKMLGEYGVKISTTLITGKKSATGSASPELARTGDGVRLITLEEPSADEEISIGYLKSLSGNDSFWARDLFEKGKGTREIVPLFKIIFICLSGNTSVSLSDGISVSLEKLIHNKNQKLLSWDSEKNGLIKTRQHAFIKKGLQNCITLTLQDGRKITCTPNHKFLTNDNNWIEAQDIKINDTFLKMGIDNPKCDDIFEDYNYVLNCGEYTFNCEKYDDRLQAMAYSRLLGYILSDGSCNKLLYPGHQIDGQSILDDIKLLTNKIPKLFKNKKVFQTSLPSNLVRSISTIIKYQKGGRINNDMILPDFIFDNNCPTFIIREFVAGLFGGDGIIPCFVKNAFTNIQLVASKINEKLDSLIDVYNNFSKMLKDRFDIESYVTTIPYKDEPKTYAFLNINKTESKIKFCENIGTRYCCHKSYRLMSVASYYRYKNLIINQNQMIIKRTKELYDKYNFQNPKPLIVQKDKNTFDIINTFKSTQEVENNLGIYHSNIRGACLRTGFSGGYLWEYKYIDPIKQDEDGCDTLKNSYLQAVNEITDKIGIINKKYIINYTQTLYYLNNNIVYNTPSINIKEFLEQNNLFQFMNQGLGKKHKHYSVDKDRDTLPCYKMQIINITNSGLKEVFDINVDEPYSNFLAEGILTHNCNKLPRFKGADKATWNRVRVIPFEATFVRPEDPEGCPDSFEDQMRAKRFPMDKTFSSKIPDLVEAFAWILLEHRKTIKERIEPEKVTMATELYRQQNDFYRRFNEESIIEEPGRTLTLLELYENFCGWYKLEGFRNSAPLKEEVKEYFSSMWGEPTSNKWKGYRIRTLKDDIDSGNAIVLDETDLVDYENSEIINELPPL